MNLASVCAALRRKGNKARAEVSKSFFKTGPGEYGEGDLFIGISVPEIRKLSKQANGLGQGEVTKLLRSKIHEERLLALLVLVEWFKHAEEGEREKIFNFYLKHTRYINNWDLVDLSAPEIIGRFIAENKTNGIVRKLAKSESLWERRIAIVGTFGLIKQGSLGLTLSVAKLLLTDEHDLIHKAVGWMLREVGKRDLEAEEGFLRMHYKAMPRTMLRYAIERFPETKRKAYLLGKI